MSSNDEHAQSGDTIEITTHLRNDLGKRMQVSTSDTLSVIALDNRMRVTVAHGDYTVVRRCGRPATADAPKKRGRPSNAEIAARTQTPAAVELPKAKVEPKAVVTDADVAGLEEAIVGNSKAIQEACNVPAELLTGDVVVHVTRKVEKSLTDPRPNIPHETVMSNARALLDAKKQPNTPPRSQASAPAEDGNADKPAPGERETAAEDKIAHLTQEQIDAATENLRPLYGVSQADFDAMTRQTEPHGFVQTERKHSHYFKTVPCNQIDVYRVLAAFGVADPCIQHALKKLLVAGGRGTKDQSRDVQEAIDSLYRWQEMRAEEDAA